MKKLIIYSLLVIILGLQTSPLANGAYGIPNYGKEKMPLQEKLEKELKTNGNYQKDAETTGIILVLQIFTSALLYVAAPVAIGFVAYGGMSYAWSMGEQEKLDGAKKTLIWAILGLLLIIMSYGIVRLIISTLTKLPS